MFGLPGLSVNSRIRNWPSSLVSRDDVEPAVDMAVESRAIDVGRRGRRRRCRYPAAAWCRSRCRSRADRPPARDGPNPRSPSVPGRRRRTPNSCGGVRCGRIGVVAAAGLHGRLDQEAAGVIADRAERIVVAPQPPTRRLPRHGTGDRRGNRRAVDPGGWQRRRRHRRGRPVARTEPVRPRLPRIESVGLAPAIQRIVARDRGAGRGRGAIGRNSADSRRRRGVERREPITPSARPTVSGVLRNGRSCNCTNPPRCGRNRSRVRPGPARGGIKPKSSRHAESARGASARWRRALAGPRLTIENSNKSNVMGKPDCAGARGRTSWLRELKQLWLTGG